MTKTNSALNGFAIASLFTGAAALAAAAIGATVFGTAWLADYLYSGTFEADGIGPVVSYWQFVGGVVLLRVLRGLQVTKSD